MERSERVLNAIWRWCRETFTMNLVLALAAVAVTVAVLLMMNAMEASR